MASIMIRPATIGDAETIAAFNAAMAFETEGLELDRPRLLRGVLALLGDGSKGFYVIAERDGVIAGQMMITFEWSDWRDGVFWWIQSVYVHPEHRRSGIFRSLYDHIERSSRQNSGVCGLRLYVERDNAHARATYASLGMTHTPYELYEQDYVIARHHENGTL